MKGLAWGQPVPVELLLNAVRGFMLGVPADDQQTLSAISRWKPWRGQWDPQNYTYGAFYLAAAGTALAIAQLTGHLRGDLSTENVLRSPDLAAALYRSVRALSAFSNGVCALLVYFLLCRDLSWAWAVWGALIFLFSPLVITLSHLAKPHTLGCALILSGIFLHQRRASPYAVMTLMGLSAACLVTNYLALAATAIALRHGKAMLLGLTVSLVANYPVLINASAFINNALTHHIGVYHQGQLSVSETFSYLKHFFRFGFPGLLLPAVFWGFWQQKKIGPTAYGMIGMGLLYAVVDFVCFRHHGIGLLPTALFCASAAYGLKALPHKPIAALLALAVLSLQVHAIVLGKTRFVRKGNLTDAGAWMNANIKPLATVSLLTHNVTPATTPAFSFLSYRVLLTPLDSAEGRIPKSDYLVLSGAEPMPSAWAQCFDLAHEWMARPKDENPFLLTHENIAVSIWGKRHGR